MIFEVETGSGGNGTSVAGPRWCATGGRGGNAVILFGVTSGDEGGDDTPFKVTAICREKRLA